MQRAAFIAAIAAGLLFVQPVWAQKMTGPAIEPAYSIWDVKLGEPVSQIPEMDVIDISCGTKGGPPSVKLSGFADFMTCTPEPSGLREIYFGYDDEQDYIARALEQEYKVFQGGTSIYAHPVMLSVLVDEDGIVRGIRVVTDDRVSDRERRVAVTLMRNLKGLFGSWAQTCTDLPLKPGENPVGRQFVHEVCTAENPELGQRLYLEAYYLRKRGQDALNRETQQVNAGYFSSGTWLEVVQVPYQPAAGAGLEPPAAGAAPL